MLDKILQFIADKLSMLNTKIDNAISNFNTSFTNLGNRITNNSDSINNLKSDVRRLYYTAGDTISFNNLYISATLTGSQKSLNFTLPLNKPIIGVSNGTVVSMNAIVRHEEKYWIGSGSNKANLKSLGDVYISDLNNGNAITIHAQLNKAIGDVNNCVVSLNVVGNILLS